MVTNVGNTGKETGEEKFSDVALALPGEVGFAGAAEPPEPSKSKKCKNASCGYVFSILLNIALIVVVGVLVHKITLQRTEIRELKMDVEEYEVTPSAVVEKDNTVDVYIIVAGGFRDWVEKENGGLTDWYKNRYCKWFVRWYRRTPEDDDAEIDDTPALPGV